MKWPYIALSGDFFACSWKTVDANSAISWISDPAAAKRCWVQDRWCSLPSCRRVATHLATNYFHLPKIISGGQTGADRAALDWAIERGLQHGGWCPRGRKAEDGVIAAKYALVETASANYRVRTRGNVLDSDATLIANIGDLDGGSLETLRIAKLSGKSVRVVQLDKGATNDDVGRRRVWLTQPPIVTLNVAGPRESKRPGIYSATRDLLDRLF